MNFLLNIDSWTAINKWTKGKSATFHNYSSKKIKTAIKNGYLELIKAKFANEIDIALVRTAIYASQYEIVKWMCEQKHNDDKMHLHYCIEWSNVSSLEIAELIYPKVYPNGYEGANQEELEMDYEEEGGANDIASLITTGQNMSIINFLHEKGHRADPTYLTMMLDDYKSHIDFKKGFSYEKLKLLQKYYPGSITFDIVVRLEDTPEVREFLQDTTAAVIWDKIMRSPKRKSTKHDPSDTVYKIDSVNLQILKKYYELYSVAKSFYWKRYHKAISNDRLEVIQWLWEIGVTFEMKEDVERNSNTLLIACQNALITPSNKTVVWLLEQPSFMEFIKRQGLIINAEMFFSQLYDRYYEYSWGKCYAQKLEETVQRLRLFIDKGIILKKISRATQKSHSLRLSIILLQNYYEQEMKKSSRYIIRAVKDCDKWFFIIKYDHHFRTLKFANDKKFLWIPEKDDIKLTPLLYLTEIMIKVMLDMHDGHKIVKWYYYNVFHPYATERFLPSDLLHIESRLIQPITTHQDLYARYLSLLRFLLKLGNIEYLVDALECYLRKHTENKKIML